MGHITDARGRLVCDACGDSGDTRKRRCPARCVDGLPYCGGSDLCARCFAVEKSSGAWTRHHAGCPAGAAASDAAEAARAAEPDQWARTAWGDWADGVPAGMAKVQTHAGTIVLLPKADYAPNLRGFGAGPDAIYLPAEQPQTKEVYIVQ